MNSFQRINLRRTLAIMYAALIIPLIIIAGILMYELNVFCRSYDAIVWNVTRANEYNLKFKNDFDMAVYQMIARSVTKEEVASVAGLSNPDDMINEAEAATEAVQKEGKFVVDGKLVIFKKGMKFNANGARIY